MSQDLPPPGGCARPAHATATCRFAACHRPRFFLAHDLVRKPVPTFRDHARDQRLSLALASSCSLRAASLAKGEFGSGALSRRSLGALVANRPPSLGGRGGRSDRGLRGG